MYREQVITNGKQPRVKVHPTTSSANLDPGSIMQTGVYLIEEQVGNFRLAIKQITAIR